MAGLIAAATALSCDEGRLLTDVEKQPFTATIEGPNGPIKLFVGQPGEYEAVVHVDGEPVTSDVIHWAASPEAAVDHDPTDLRSVHTVTPLLPGTVTLTAEPRHPALMPTADSTTFTAMLQAVVPLAPSSGDTTITAVGDSVTVRGQGLGVGGAVAASAGLLWEHHGSALRMVTATLDRDSLRLVALQPGTDTLVFRQEDDLCEEGQCIDTIFVRVIPTAARVDVVPVQHTFTALGQTAEFTARAFDANGNAVAGASFTWSDSDPGLIAFTPDGTSDTTTTATAQSNGTTWLRAAVRGTSVTDSAEITVTQVPATISVLPGVDTLGAGETVQLTATVTDANGQAIDGTSVEWTSFDTNVATVSGTGVVTGVSSGTVNVIGRPTGTTITPDTAFITVTAHVLEFDGDDYASTAADPLDLDPVTEPDGWTIEAWVKPVTLVGTQYLLNKGNAVRTNNASSYGLFLEAGIPTAYVRSSNGGAATAMQTVAAPASLAINAWHHVAVTFDNVSAQVTLYVDGGPVASATFGGGPHDVAGELIFGAATSSLDSPLTGRLDEVRYWSDVRTPTEIADSYDARLAGDEAGLLAYWPIEGGTGNPVDIVAGLIMARAAGANAPTWIVEDPILP